MPRFKFKYSTWVIIVAVLGLAIGSLRLCPPHVVGGAISR